MKDGKKVYLVVCVLNWKRFYMKMKNFKRKIKNKSYQKSLSLSFYVFSTFVIV